MSQNWYVTDMDGTFLTSSNELYHSAISVVKNLQQYKIPFYIATGRLDLMIKSYYYELGLDVPVISCNGALIRNLATNEIIDSTHFTFDELQSLLMIIKLANLDYHVYTPSAVYGERMSGRIAYLSNFEKNYPKALRTPFIIADDVILEIKRQQDLPLKILIIEQDHDKVLQLYQQLSNQADIEGTFSGSHLFDIMKKGVSKGAALKKLADYYQYQLEDCIAFGDNDNDLSMLSIVGTAVVPNNAHQKIKDQADIIIDSNDDGGVVKYLQEYVLNL